MTVTTNLQAQSPKEIDAQLAEIGGRQAQATYAVAGLQRQIASLQDSINRSSSAYMHDLHVEHIAKLDAQLPAAEAAIEALRVEAAPFHAEFRRRGGWTRAFLVTNTGGHVHNTTACATCFATTQFAWLPEVSGDDESTIVERAGEAACTVCYPSAPVDVLKRRNTFEAPDRKAARIEREAKAAARAAKAAATGIANPDGSPLRGRYGVIKTERTAQIEAVDEIANHAIYGYRFDAEYLERLQVALAHKRGQSVEQVALDVQAKATAKIKRESR